jgi:hypothetical protein
LGKKLRTYAFHRKLSEVETLHLVTSAISLQKLSAKMQPALRCATRVFIVPKEKLMVERRPAYQRILLKLSGEALAGDADMGLTLKSLVVWL